MTAYTKEQINFANHASVLSYMSVRGISVKREARDKFRGIEHDSLIITPSKNAWFWNSRDIHGSGALSFAINYELSDSNLSDGEKFDKAMKRVLNANVDEAPAFKEVKHPFNPASVKLGSNYSHVLDYFANQRKISSDVTKALIAKHRLFVNPASNLAIFPIEDNQNKIVGAMEQGFEKRGKRSYKKMMRDTNADFGWYFDSFDCNQNNMPHHLRIFESEIDAISYYNLSLLANKPLTDTRFVAMDGLKSVVVKNALLKLVHDLKGQEDTPKIDLVICCDNDQAGDKFYQEMSNVFSKIKRHSPTAVVGKDWNDALKYYQH